MLGIYQYPVESTASKNRLDYMAFGEAAIVSMALSEALPVRSIPIEIETGCRARLNSTGARWEVHLREPESNPILPAIERRLQLCSVGK